MSSEDVVVNPNTEVDIEVTKSEDPDTGVVTETVDITEITLDTDDQNVENAENAENTAQDENAKENVIDSEVEVEIPVEQEEVVKEHPDDAELRKARESLKAAQENYLKATQSVLEDANEYLLESLDESVADVVRDAQMESSLKWYNFWEKATRVPKDSKYTTVLGNKMTFKEIAKKNEEYLQLLTSEETDEEWKKITTTKGITITFNPSRSTGTKLYKLTTNVNVAPRVLLLMLTRGPVLGSADNDLMYFREHYNFIGSKTSLVHTIRKVSTYDSVLPREFFDLTSWSEDADGNIFYTAQGIKSPALKAKLPSGKVVKGALEFLGIKLMKSENGGTDVTLISKRKINGWVPQFILDWNMPQVLVDMLDNWIKGAKEVAESGEENADKLVRKFVLRELEA